VEVDGPVRVAARAQELEPLVARALIRPERNAPPEQQRHHRELDLL
jgi:hypothetical protein